MRRNLQFTICAFALLFASNSFAQQITPYASFYSQPVLLNPAYVGFHGTGQGFLLLRQQWVGISGAPQTGFVNVDGDISQSVGMGVQVFSERDNIFSNTGALFTLKYRVKLGEESSLSFAGQGGASQYRLSFDRVRIGAGEDDLLFNQSQTAVKPEVNAGLVYRYKKMYIGLAGQQLIGSGVEFQDDLNTDPVTYRLIRHFNATARYTLRADKKLMIEPFVVARSVQGQAIFPEGGVFLNFDKKFWIGGGYRHESEAHAGAGALIQEKIRIWYNYLLPLSDISGQTSGSHEIGIGFNFLKTETIQNRTNRKLKKEMKQMQNDALLQYERIDQQNQRIDQLNKEILELSQRLKTANEKRVDERSEIRDKSEAGVSDQQLEELKRELLQKIKELNEQQSMNGPASQEEFDKAKKGLEENRKEKEISSQLRSKSSSEDLTPTNVKGRLNYLQKYYKMKDAGNFNHYLILGAYKPKDAAEKYQEYLKTEQNIATQLVRHESRNMWYVSTTQTNDVNAAIAEVEPKIDDDFVINGMPWVFRKLK